jgi:hypothetical protein
MYLQEVKGVLKSLTKRAGSVSERYGSGSILKCHGSGTLGFIEFLLENVSTGRLLSF